MPPQPIPRIFAIKNNAAQDGYATLLFDDFFNLETYGLIVICAHGISRPVKPEAPDDFDLDWSGENAGKRHYYIQVRAEVAIPDNPPPGWLDEHVGSISLGEELKRGRVVVVNQVEVSKKSHTSFLYMRDDLWQERMKGLPNSLFILCSPFGWLAQEAAGSHNAGDFLGWDGTVSTQAGLDGTWMVPFMARFNDADLEAFNNGAIPQSLDGSAYQLWPAGNTFLYLPAWAEVRIRSWPAGTRSTLVEMAYSDPSIPPPNPKLIEDPPEPLKSFADLFPGEQAAFTGKAIDSGRIVLAEHTKVVILNSGRNDVNVDLNSYGMILEASPAQVPLGGTITVTATLRAWMDGDVDAPTGAPVPLKQVEFSTTRGTMVGNPAQTNESGQAIIKIQSSLTAGTAKVTATSKPELLQKSITVTFGI